MISSTLKLCVVNLTFFLFSILSNAQVMFRETPEHISIVKGEKNHVFNALAWKFNASAPIRSTPCADGHSIYFGSSDGIFRSIEKNTGKLRWQFNAGHAIASSAALFENIVFFSDNKQALHALNTSTGKPVWKFDFGISREYEWKFDYFYSSPTIVNNSILIGAMDGFVHHVSLNGKNIWKFKTEGIVRSTPAVSGKVVYFGDTDGILYAVDMETGKEKFRFTTTGHEIKNEEYGFDRRAIISSPAVKNDKLVFGGRDGFLYCINKNSGGLLWKMDHEVSWVISSVAIRDSIVVTGTSDGRFIQAIHINTGKEIWKYRTQSIVWSSPVIYDNAVYIGSGEGVLYGLDLLSGKLITRFQTGDNIFSSPVISSGMLFFGSDDGFFYALRHNEESLAPSNDLKKFVFWEPGVNSYFKPGTDVRIRSYLAGTGYTVINSEKLDSILKLVNPIHSVIVFASNYFPASVTKEYELSALRIYLDNGGKVVMLGSNPLVWRTDSSRSIIGWNFLLPDSVLGIHYGPNDLRSFRGLHPAFVTKEGVKFGLRKFWVSPMGISSDQVDMVLGIDENGLASSWIKKYNQGRLIQVWADPAGDDDLSYILKIAEY